MITARPSPFAARGGGRGTMTYANDQGLNDQGLERRTFLKQMAVASTAPLAPGLLGAATAQEGSVHQETAHETERLAAHPEALRYEDLPAPVVERAKACIADTVAAIIYGAELPW